MEIDNEILAIENSLESIKEKKGIVYCATNKINNKKYIGITTKSLRTRVNQHFNDAKKGRGFYFHSAIIKYGEASFDWSILEEVKTKELLLEKEKFFIKELKTNNTEFGYNLTNGGEFYNGPKSNNYWLGKKHKPETIEKMKIAQLGDKHPNFGKHWNAEINKKKGRKGKDHPNFGKTFSDETKAKMSKWFFKKGCKRSEEFKKWVSENFHREKHPRAKKVQCIETGEIFECIKNVQDKYSIDRVGISKCCTGKQKTAGGFTWRHI